MNSFGMLAMLLFSAFFMLAVLFKLEEAGARRLKSEAKAIIDSMMMDISRRNRKVNQDDVKYYRQYNSLKIVK